MTNKLSEYNTKKLSIQVRLDGLSFFIQNLETKEVLYYNNHTFDKKVDAQGLTQEVEKLYNTDLRLQETFKKVEVAYTNSLFTFVPKAVFKEDFISDYLKFNTKILATDYIAFDTLEEQEVICVYVPYTNCNNLFFDYYGSFEYHHSMSILVQDALRTATKKSDNPVILINIHATSFEIVVHKEKQLLLANSFDFKTKEDFIYYVLFTMEQLELDPETAQIDLVGKISLESDLYKIAYTYIRNVTIMNKNVAQIAKTDYTSSILV